MKTDDAELANPIKCQFWLSSRDWHVNFAVKRFSGKEIRNLLRVIVVVPFFSTHPFRTDGQKLFTD